MFIQSIIIGIILKFKILYLLILIYHLIIIILIHKNLYFINWKIRLKAIKAKKKKLQLLMILKLTR